ncbi:hypothetical protein ZWY2020_042558 [Hordeum vulgare]|nr:hypothetical protein ZWY2020_042558 [Hordeum vulgare]
MAFLGDARCTIFTVQATAPRNLPCTLLRSEQELQPPRTPTSYTRSGSKAAPEVEFVSHRDRPFRFLDRMAIVQALTAETPSPWRQVPGDTRGARQDGVGHGANLLQRHHHGHRSPSSIPSPSVRLHHEHVGRSFQMQPRRPSYRWHAHLGHAHLRAPLRALRRASRATNGIPTAVAGVGLVFPSLHVHRRRGDVPKKVAVERHPDAIPMVRLPMSAFPLARRGVFASTCSPTSLAEFFYSQVPPALKSMSTYIVLLVDLFFWLLAVLSFINFLNYLYWASWYKYVKPEDEDENVDEQQV